MKTTFQFMALLSTLTLQRSQPPSKDREEQLQAAPALTGGPVASVYDAKTEQVHIGPSSWVPFPHVDSWLQRFLENLSTSPLAETPSLPPQLPCC